MNDLTLFKRYIGSETYDQIADIDSIEFEKYPDVKKMVEIITIFPIAVITWRVNKQEFMLINQTELEK